jgi:uncharacterized membrane protein YhhN
LSGSSEWRKRGYWVLACGLLPLLNPIALAVVTIASDTNGPPWVLVAICIALVNLLLLWLAASVTWKRDGRPWWVALALLLSVTLSVPYGFGELLLFLDITCPESGCFN